MAFYHVYCETEGAEIITPSYADALSTFKQYVRNYPDEVVDFDTFEGLGENDTMPDIADGVYEGKRIRVMQCCPD